MKPSLLLHQAVTLEMVSKHSSTVECSSLFELFNRHHPSYKHDLSQNFSSFVSKVAGNYPHIDITVDKNEQREMIHAEYFDLYATLKHYPPVSKLASTYGSCPGFNFYSPSGRCQFFATSENAAYSTNDTSCPYYKVTLKRFEMMNLSAYFDFYSSLYRFPLFFIFWHNDKKFQVHFQKRTAGSCLIGKCV